MAIRSEFDAFCNLYAIGTAAGTEKAIEMLVCKEKKQIRV